MSSARECDVQRRGRCQRGALAAPGRRSAAVFVLALAFAACGEDGASGAGTLRVGQVQIPESLYANLQEPERQMLADLVGFGSAIALDGIVDVNRPFVERSVGEARLINLPFFLGAQAMGLDEAALAARYEEAPEWELTVRHVVRLVASDASQSARDSAFAVANEVARRAAAGEDFASLAATFSEEPGAAERGGLLQPGRLGTWVDPFWEAAVQLDPGEMSPVVESPYGYHVLRLDERRPVPFAEADRGRLLRRVVPLAAADAEMGRWVGGQPDVMVDEANVATVLDLLLTGGAIPVAMSIASSDGLEYTGEDLAAGWARIPAETRATFEREDGAASVRSWIETEARQVIWQKQAAELRVPVSIENVLTAENEWEQTAILLGRAFAFRPGMSDSQLLAASSSALLSGTPEARSARIALRALRPRLRQMYPVESSTLTTP